VNHDAQRKIVSHSQRFRTVLLGGDFMKNLSKRTTVFLSAALLSLSLLLTACPAPTDGGAAGGAAPTDTTGGATDTTGGATDTTGGTSQ
jgi:hypothetical protein